MTFKNYVRDVSGHFSSWRETVAGENVAKGQKGIIGKQSFKVDRERIRK